MGIGVKSFLRGEEGEGWSEQYGDVDGDIGRARER